MNTRRSSGGNVETAAAAASSQEERNVTTESVVETVPTACTGAETNDIPGDIIEPRETINGTEAPSAPVATLNSIVVDLNEDDSDEPLLPMRMGRAGLTTEKARSLFAQHGFQYEPRCWQPQQEPPNKIRRVEKPIRLRVHYTCHECRRQFGVQRTCLSCGHQRCRQCSRDPPRKVRELSDDARRSMEEEQARPVAGPSTSPPVAEPVVTSSPPAMTAPEMLTGPLDPDQSGEYTTDAQAHEYDFTMYTRPRSAIQTGYRAKARARSHAHSHDTSNTSAEDETPMVHAVQRVYRKPRQRVRYTCENCETLFVTGNRCHECGHERCDTCHREP